MLHHEAVTAKPGLGNLVSELRADVASGKSVPALAAGLSSGLSLLVAYVAFGTARFSGPVATLVVPERRLGALFGTFASRLIIAFTGGYRGAIAGLSPALVKLYFQHFQRWPEPGQSGKKTYRVDAR